MSLLLSLSLTLVVDNNFVFGPRTNANKETVALIEEGGNIFRGGVQTEEVRDFSKEPVILGNVILINYHTD